MAGSGTKRKLVLEDVLTLIQEDSESDYEDSGSEDIEDINPTVADRAEADAEGDVDEPDVDLDRDQVVPDQHVDTHVQGEDYAMDPPAPADSYEPNLQWAPPSVRPPVNQDFTGEPGIKVNTDNFSPFDFFRLYLNDNILDIFVRETNLYALEFITANQGQLPPYSTVHKWTPTYCDEMVRFLGLNILMGVIKKPKVADYWSTDVLLETSVFNKTMTRNRFNLLTKFWHITSSANAPNPRDENRDRLWKLRPLLTHLLERFEAVYMPARCLSVDESLLLWKGRLYFKQYLPLKRARFGIKQFMLCEATTGYTSRFRVYCGKEDPSTAMDAAIPAVCRQFGVSEKVVLWLMGPFLDQGYRVYMDNWYNSVRLVSYLLSRLTDVCGTIRSNRIPLGLRNTRLDVGGHHAIQAGNITVLKWRDKKDVHMISTMHQDQMVNSNTRGGLKQKPACVAEYNVNMGGVDKQDQLLMLEPYNIARKTLKWYKKLSFRLMHVALLNAHILNNMGKDSQLRFVDFTQQVVKAMLFDNEIPPILKPNEDLQRLTGRHFPARVEASATWQNRTVRCRVCAKKDKRTSVRTYCPSCSSKPGLCAHECFEKWHTKVKYWE